MVVPSDVMHYHEDEEQLRWIIYITWFAQRFTIASPWWCKEHETTAFWPWMLLSMAPLGLYHLCNYPYQQKGFAFLPYCLLFHKFSKIRICIMELCAVKWLNKDELITLNTQWAYRVEWWQSCVDAFFLCLHLVQWQWLWVRVQII